MHRDNIALRYLGGRGRGLPSKQFVTDLRVQGFSCDDTIEAVCRVFGVPRGAAPVRGLASGVGVQGPR